MVLQNACIPSEANTIAVVGFSLAMIICCLLPMSASAQNYHPLEQGWEWYFENSTGTGQQHYSMIGEALILGVVTQLDSAMFASRHHGESRHPIGIHAIADEFSQFGLGMPIQKKFGKGGAQRLSHHHLGGHLVGLHGA